jgi:hypothetical protein
VDTNSTVTFTESGLPSGTDWTVTLGSTTVSSTTSTLSFSRANGTYPFSVGPVEGYSAAPGAGSISVQGQPVSQSIAFKSTTGSSPGGGASTFLGLTSTEGYALLLLLLILIVVAGVVAYKLQGRRRAKTSNPPSFPPGAGNPPTPPS